jgi:hypothetical protein
VDIPGDQDSRGPWVRVGHVLDGVEGRGALHGSPVLHRYRDDIGVPADMLPPLFLMYWVDHIAPRIAARGSDAAWLQKRVLAPLRRIGALV